MFLHDTCSRVLVCSYIKHAVECWYVPISDMQWSGGMFLRETCSGLVECSSNRHVVEPSNVPT